MRYAVIHHGQKWHRPNNHLDGRVCPRCWATVHGKDGQKHHEQWHADQDQITVGLHEIVARLCTAVNIEQDTEDGFAWDGITSGTELEASDG